MGFKLFCKYRNNGIKANTGNLFIVLLLVKLLHFFYNF